MKSDEFPVEIELGAQPPAPAPALLARPLIGSFSICLQCAKTDWFSPTFNLLDARSRAPFIHILFNAADIISRRRGRIHITAKKDRQTGDSPPTCTP